MKKRLGRHSLFIAMFVFALFLTACAGGSSSSSSSSEGAPTTTSDTEGIQEMQITITHVVAENTPKHQGALAMKEYIEEQSGGKIKVNIFPNSTLFGDQDEYQNLVANNVQFIIPSTNKLIGQNSKFTIPAIPFLFDSDEKALEFWDGPKGQEIMKSLEKDGVLGIAIWPNGEKHLTNDVRPVRKPEDLEGLKLRSDGGKIVADIYAPFNVSTETIPFGELYLALEQGIVDGQENPFSNIESQKFDEVQKYLTILGHTRVDYVLLTNTTFWSSLNDKTRNIIEEGAWAGTEKARAEAHNLNAQALELIKERGHMEIIELTPEEREAFKEAFSHIKEMYKDVIGEDVLEEAERINNQ